MQMIFFSLQSLYVTYVYKQSIYYLKLMIVFVPGFPKILHWFRAPERRSLLSVVAQCERTVAKQAFLTMRQKLNPLRVCVCAAKASIPLVRSSLSSGQGPPRPAA